MTTSLEDLTERRRNSIIVAGHRPDEPPAWAFLANPVARALMEAGGVDLAAHRPKPEPTMMECGSLTWTCTVNGWIAGYTRMRTADPAKSVLLDATGTMARIVVEGNFPESIVQALPGRPFGEFLDLRCRNGPNISQLPIRGVWHEGRRLGFAVECPLAPLADAPAGTDAGWLREWLRDHGAG